MNKREAAVTSSQRTVAVAFDVVPVIVSPFTNEPIILAADPPTVS